MSWHVRTRIYMYLYAAAAFSASLLFISIFMKINIEEEFLLPFFPFHKLKNKLVFLSTHAYMHGKFLKISWPYLLPRVITIFCTRRQVSQAMVKLVVVLPRIQHIPRQGHILELLPFFGEENKCVTVVSLRSTLWFQIWPLLIILGYPISVAGSTQMTGWPTGHPVQAYASKVQSVDRNLTMHAYARGAYIVASHTLLN